MTDERRTAPMIRLRELEQLKPGTLVMASSAPAPRYFLRVHGGWHAADATGCTALQRVLHAELPGWPEKLQSIDIRRPAIVVAYPDDLDPGLPELADLQAIEELQAHAARLGRVVA